MRLAPFSLRFCCSSLLAWALLLGGSALWAQSAPAAPAEAQNRTAQNPRAAISSAIAGLKPATSKIGAVLPELHISHWRASRELRASASSDAESIQQDLGGRLPELVEKAEASGEDLAPAFSVYRNVGALYDVLLRVASLANVAGSRQEASSLESARAALEAGQSKLGDALIRAAAAQDAELARVKKLAAAAAAAPPPQTIVINDGPVKKHPRHHKK